ncbi:anti-sigma factor family protein [Paludibaculum fermentans]|uniref:anti-sigma factor family protein n=1 Tax=Paludibaculum fermentans TaxID=1473598 RepID=UPI003EC0DD26
MTPEAHISEEELLLAMDGELDAPRAAQVHSHLLHCWDCRARRTRLEQSIAGYMDLHRSAQPLPIPPIEGPAAKLRASLRLETPPSTPQSWWRWTWTRPTPSFLAGALALLITPLALLLWLSANKVEAAGPLPDGRLTPGAAHTLSRQQVCGAPTEDEGRLVPAHLARLVFAEYRIHNPRPRTYEVDYLISPSLGGASELSNLWPVPYDQGVWTSRVKDALEAHLRTLVCEGQLDLPTAQHEISTNWIAAYQKHFHARKPLPAHTRFVKDSPWE